MDVVLDTNVFVAAGFNRRSESAKILADIRRGQLRMIWNEATRSETRHILQQIPPLSWEDVADVFVDEDRYDEETRAESFAEVPDPDDRKFAALASASQSVLITSDAHLLALRGRRRVEVMSPGEFRRRL